MPVQRLRSAVTGPFLQQLSDREFQRVTRLVESSVGIHLSEHKRSMVELRTARRARAAGIPDLAAYCKFVFEKRGQAERLLLIEALTTNKTEFFREADHFEQLVQCVLPALTPMLSEGGEQRPFRVWSAGCSTGEEPYTIAFVLARYALTRPSFEFSVLGSDINSRVLQAAARAVYPEESISRVPPEYRRSAFLRHKNHGLQLVRVAPEMRQYVRFVRHNLFEPALPHSEAFDVIFCRNVIIYFERETQIKVLRNLARALRPGGYLFVGHSEALHGMPLPLEHLGPTLYRKTTS